MRNAWRRSLAAAKHVLGFAFASREEREMREEMRFHLEMAVQKHRSAGMSADDARRLAAIEFGGVSHWGDAARDEYRSRVVDDLARDIRYAIRSVSRAPVFAAAAILSLAIGIGATSTIWTVVERVVLRPLPYGRNGQLVMLWTNFRSKPEERGVNSLPDYLDWTTGNPDVQSSAVFNIWTPVLTEGGRPEPLLGSRVSAHFFDVLGVPPLLGRGFRLDEDVPNGPRVAVIAYSLWQRRFHGDSAIVGKTIDVNALKYTVVGVMPPSFRDPEPLWKHGAELWRPINLVAADEQRGWHYLRAIARLRPGLSLERAQADLRVISDRLGREYPNSNKDRGAIAVSMHEQVVGEARPILFAALGGALCLLLIVCGNVASLVLARNAARAPEIGVRTAIGAGQGRIRRMLIVESCVVAFVSAALGLCLAIAATSALRRIAPPDLPRVGEIRVDAAVVAMTALVAGLSVLMFGLLPAVRAARVDVTSMLHFAGSRASSRGRVRRAIVVAELAFSVVLLISAGLLAKSALRLNAVPLGLEPDDLLSFRVNLPGVRYQTDSARRAFFTALEDRLRRAPGVTDFAMTSYLPLTELNDTEVLIGGPVERPVRNGFGARLRGVSPGLFRLLRVSVRGREFDAHDTGHGSRVALINRAAADALYPGENPIGRRLLLTPSDTTPATIVGVVGNVRFSGPASNPETEVFQPGTQSPWSTDAIVLRGVGSSGGLLTAAREAVRSVDPTVGLSDIEMMRDIARAFSERQRFYASIFAFFAGAALLLCAIGVYGVISYTIAQQRREIGIRMALGATGTDIARRLIGQAAAIALIGATIGASGGIVFQRLLRALFFEVAPTDPSILVGSAALLAAVALIASAVPGVRAGRASPAAALRGE